MDKELQEARRTMSHHIETINKKIEIMKRKQIENLEMKSTITEIKNSLKSRKRKE